MYIVHENIIFMSNFIVMADISKCIDTLNGLGGLGFGSIFTT